MNEIRKRDWAWAAMLVFALAVTGCNRADEPAALGSEPAPAAVAEKGEPPAEPPAVEDEKARAERPVISRQGRAAVEEEDGKPSPTVAGPTPADLPPVTAPSHDYPPFEGKPIAVVHTENVIGELEPCG
jgi:hypothetical protein